MGFFSKIKRGVLNTLDPAELIKRDGGKKRPAAPVDPDPINPLTGRPMSQNVPQDPSGGQPATPMQGLGQLPAAYLPAAVSMAQRLPQGLGRAAFASTLAPLQQQGYGLGQVDPRFLTGQMRVPGGSNAGIGFTPPQMPIAVANPRMYT